MSIFDVIVIGSGFGGLASALTLKSMGLNVAIIEALDKIGGRAYAEEKSGYKFDRGPSIITAPFLIDDIFQMSGVNREDYCKFVPVDPFYTVRYHDGSQVSHYNSQDKFLAEIANIAPTEIENVKEFFLYADKIFQKGFIELGDKNFANPFSMLGVAPQLLKLNAVRPVYSMVSKFVKDEKIRQFLSFHPLLIGGNPFRAAAVYSLINRLERAYGVYHPIGGMHVLAEAFKKRFTELGGLTFLSTPVEVVDKNVLGHFEITTPNGMFTAKNIVVNADMHRFVKSVLKNDAYPRKLSRKLEKADLSMSAFLLYLGTNKTWPELSQHTIALGPRYKELLDDIFIKKIEFEDFSVYIHIPTRTDASLAPKGGEVIYALVPVPNLLSQTNWDNYKSVMVERVKKFLAEKFMPGLEESIICESIFTPSDFESTLKSHLGNAFGLEPWILQSAGFRPSNSSPEIDGLYFVGANTQPGAGLPGVILSSRITCRLLAKDIGATKMPSLLAKLPSTYSYINSI
ncbi:phytoene desaturase family protein [Pigmentibacter sp. JX0631]|uniref:phytoene desaturase family protein n=1 Tax=Pigmentibacter sp. JX0631 TaxID=2976982 RepID=UPI0024688347|nr:phytoene desaturase family protein [Pigmentibacter sp. JX0631]WGL58587.1 phytoene desaturase family protein [Pigmentibacter sp. JX0631]